MSKRRKTWFLANILLSSALSGLLLYLIFREQSLDEFTSVFIQISWSCLLLYAFLALLALLLRALRYGVLLKSTRADSGLSLGKLLMVTAVRNAFVDFLPARLGEGMFFYLLHQFGVIWPRMLTSFVLATVLDVLVLLGLLLLVGLLSSGDFVAAMGSPLLLFVSGLLLLVGCFVVLRLAALGRFGVGLVDRFCRGRENWLSSLKTFLEDVVNELELFKGPEYLKLVLLTIGLRCAKYISLYVLLIGVLPQVSGLNFGLSTLAFVSAEAAASLPASGILGFGAYEVVWATVFSAAGFDLSSPVSIIFQIHILTQVFGYFIGFSGLLAFILATRGKKSNLN